MTNLKVSARFKRLLGSSDTVRKAQNSGHLPLPVASTETTEDALTLEVDDEFRCHGIVYCVKAVREDGTVRCRLSHDDSSSDITLHHDNVKELVREFNLPS